MTPGQKAYGGLRFWCLFLAILAFVDIGLMLLLVVVHAAYPTSIHVELLTPLVYILAGSSSASVLLGTLWFALRYPQYSRIVAIVVLITLGIMVAHLYTIDTPPVVTSGSISGGVGSQFSNQELTVNSTVSGDSLSIRVLVNGGQDSIGGLSATLDGIPLPASGLSDAPTQSEPAQAGDTIYGNWSLPSAPSGGLTVQYGELTCYDTTTQVYGCVMDEIYYVPAAAALLSGEKCGPYLDNCNLEHPFLAKAMIAAGMALFGNNTFGWRFFIALLGTASIPVLFGICWKMSRDMTLSIFAALLLAFETLFFAQSSIAVIDIPMIFLGLLAFLVYVADVHVWKFDRYILSGILLALAALAKELAIFMVAFLVFYNLVFGRGSRRSRTISSLEMFAVTGVLFCAGLELYVLLFGAPSLTSFVGDIQYILKYGASLKCTAGSACGWSFFANNQAPYITPFDWLAYYFAVGYEIVRVTVTSGTQSYSYVSVGYFGVPNWLEVWLVFLWVPVVVYTGFKRWRASRAPVQPEIQTTLDSPGVAVNATENSSFELAKFALFWFLFTYVPYIFLFFYGRVTYPYYILSAIPALVIGAAYLLSRKWFPREVAWVVIAGAFAWFFIFYPDKSFLPVWLRAVLGH